MFRCLATSLLFTTTIAHADEEPPPAPAPVVAMRPAPRGFIAGGLSLGADHFINGALIVEAGVALHGTPVWLHAMGSLGGALDFEGTGAYQRAIGGIELRPCSHDRTCAFVDLDIGYEHQTWNGDAPEDKETHRGLWLGPRIGFDAGTGPGIHVRGALEVYGYRREARTPSGTTVGWQRGGELVLSLGYQL